MKDDVMMTRINEAEHTQIVAELKQRISRLELKVFSLYFSGLLQMDRTKACR